MGFQVLKTYELVIHTDGGVRCPWCVTGLVQQYVCTSVRLSVCTSVRRCSTESLKYSDRCGKWKRETGGLCDTHTAVK
jgi:hypothetical protein